MSALLEIEDLGKRFGGLQAVGSLNFSVAEAFSNFQLVIAGVLLLVIVLFVPGGLMGFVHRRWPKTRSWLE